MMKEKFNHTVIDLTDKPESKLADTKGMQAEKIVRHLINRQDPARLTRVLAVYGD